MGRARLPLLLELGPAVGALDDGVRDAALLPREKRRVRGSGAVPQSPAPLGASPLPQALVKPQMFPPRGAGSRVTGTERGTGDP